VLRSHYSALDRGDLEAAAAVFAEDAVATFPWIGAATCCRGIGQIRSTLQATIRAQHHGFAVLALVAGSDAQTVTGRIEARTQLTADPRFGRAIVATAAAFAGAKVTRLDQTFDVSDAVTARVVRNKPLVDAANASPTPTPVGGPAFRPAFRATATPPNGDVKNAEWIELDAPYGRKLLAAVRRPAGPGPFPIIVALHPGGGFTNGVVNGYLNNRGFVEAGFMVVAGCWFDGDNPLNPPDPRLIRCPNGDPYEISYAARLPYADALVRTARILPGADPDRVGIYGESQGAAEVVLLASTGTRVQGVVAVVAPYSEGFSRYDTTPLSVAADLAAPLLMLHGLVPDPSGRGLPQEAETYEAALKRLGKTYQAVYYPGVAHEDLTTNPISRDDYKIQTAAFLKKYVAPPH
jgi:dienelactone hydrolase/ketosteroid isomerase-like protein